MGGGHCCGAFTFSGKYAISSPVTTLYLAIGLSYLVIAFALTLMYVYGFKRSFSGDFWGAFLVAAVGAFLGGVIDFFFADIIQWLSSINGILNIFPPIIAAVLLLSIFAYLSERKDTYD